MASDVEVRQAIRRSLQVAWAAFQQSGHHLWRAAGTSGPAEFMPVTTRQQSARLRDAALAFTAHIHSHPVPESRAPDAEDWKGTLRSSGRNFLAEMAFRIHPLGIHSEETIGQHPQVGKATPPLA